MSSRAGRHSRWSNGALCRTGLPQRSGDTRGRRNFCRPAGRGIHQIGRSQARVHGHKTGERNFFTRGRRHIAPETSGGRGLRHWRCVSTRVGSDDRCGEGFAAGACPSDARRLRRSDLRRRRFGSRGGDTQARQLPTKSIEAQVHVLLAAGRILFGGNVQLVTQIYLS